MIAMVLELLSNAIGVVKGWFDWKNSGVGQRKAAEGIVEQAEGAAKKRKADINRACHEGDTAAVNRIVNGAIAATAATIAAFALGCASPAPQYVAADREVKCETNEVGRVLYWKVPPLVMEELLNSKVELEEIKKELKVKEITK